MPFVVEYINACIKADEFNGQSDIAEVYEPLKRNFVIQRLRPKKCFHLDELALMRLAIEINRIGDICLYCNDVKFYENIRSLVHDQGISGEWAFTVLNYLLAVHYQLIRVDEKKAFLIRNFIVKNFAYKLRGPKRVAFMATLFIGLQYDCEFENGERWVIGIGEYFFQKFLVQQYVNISEYRVYIAFVILCFAHIYAIAKGRKSIQSRNMIFSLKELSMVKVCSLWDFIRVLCKSIPKNGYVKRTPIQTENFSSLDCKKRREIAFVASRLQVDPKTESVKRWIRYLSPIE